MNALIAGFFELMALLLAISDFLSSCDIKHYLIYKHCKDSENIRNKKVFPHILKENGTRWIAACHT